jgi:hypothetical protein
VILTRPFSVSAANDRAALRRACSALESRAKSLVALRAITARR